MDEVRAETHIFAGTCFQKIVPDLVKRGEVIDQEEAGAITSAQEMFPELIPILFEQYTEERTIETLQKNEEMETATELERQIDVAARDEALQEMELQDKKLEQQRRASMQIRSYDC